MSMLIIAKALASLFAILVVARSITDFKSKKESLTMTIFWVFLWLSIIVLTFFPNLVDLFIQILGGDKTGLGTIFGMAIVFVLFICYRIYVKANRVEKNIAKLTREIALQQLKGSRKQK